MNKKQHTTQVAFRFKRWSRKGYAAFFSLKRTVTIGQLSSNVADRFLVKNGSNHSSVLIVEQRCPEEVEKDTDLSEEEVCAKAMTGLSQLLLLFSLQTVRQTAAAGSLACINSIYILKREVSVCAGASRFVISIKTEQYD